MGTMSIEASRGSSAGTFRSGRRLAATRPRARGGKASVALWIFQGLLAALFLFAGGLKLAMPVEMLAEVAPLPPLFLKFIGTCEVLGALGLILPGLLRLRPRLTPLAAAGLVVIMAGATVVTALTMDVPSAVAPLVVGLLATFVAYGRSRLAPLPASRRSSRHEVIPGPGHYSAAA